MIKNRTIPYGYIKDNGEIKVDTFESEIIKEIYLKYIQGESYKRIADSLTQRKIKYLEENKPWNKNIVDRIIQNEKYLGDGKYPEIIDSRTKEKAINSKKAYIQTEDEFIKTIKPLLQCHICESKIKRRIKTNKEERWYCENDTEHISVKLKDKDIKEQLIKTIKDKLTDFQFEDSKNKKTSLEIIELQNRIDIAIKNEEIDIIKIQEDIKKLAELKYLTLDNTVHLMQRSLDELIENPIANIKEAKKVISEILIKDINICNITLKNKTKL